MQFVFAAVFGLTLLNCGIAPAQQVAGSVESGLQTLAQDLIAKTPANDANVIAVLPFPNSDGSCSVLSTHLVDELTPSLLSQGGSRIKLVERAQIEALLSDHKYGEGGLLSPETTQKIGTLTGAKAFVVGAISSIGDHVRINARLISTANGQVISAANVSIARNGEIDGLLQHAIGSSKGICGNAVPDNAESVRGDTGAVPSGVDPTRPDGRAITHEGIAFSVQTVSRSPDKKTISIVLALTDQTASPIRVYLTSPAPSIIDSFAGVGSLMEANGIQVCEHFIYSAGQCSTIPRIRWTTLSPKLPTVLLLRFESKQTLDGDKLSFAASLLVEPVDAQDSAKSQPTLISLSLANLAIPAKGK